MHKYPRTPHLEGSRLQPGDQDLSAVPFAEIRGRHLVVEEKLDGANAAIGFLPDGSLHLQSRGHPLAGGPRERHFALLKTWAGVHQGALREALGSRYLLFGEWLHARHTTWYDALPHYFLEFDLLDLETGHFLDTPGRRALLAGLPLVSVPVLHEGPVDSLAALLALVGPSRYRRPGWPDRLAALARERGLDPARVLAETDSSDLAEGLYLKVEAGGRVLRRLKWVRPGFVQAIVDSDGHWLDRPMVPNLLAEGVDLFAP